MENQNNVVRDLPETDTYIHHPGMDEWIHISECVIVEVQHDGEYEFFETSAYAIQDEGPEFCGAKVNSIHCAVEALLSHQAMLKFEAEREERAMTYADALSVGVSA